MSVATLLLPSSKLDEDMAFFEDMGFRLQQIYPSDDPAVAVLVGHQMQVRLDRNADVAPGVIHLLTDDPKLLEKPAVTAPNGTRFQWLPKTYQLEMPVTHHQFEVRKLRDEAPWVIGRAGMLYRDLIPNRLGGSIIASHIRIPNGGPVPDMVHYHTIGFQLIFCYRGWVRLVYEDQGPPFILRAGDCVIQPPEIRHQVLEASDQLEVIEIGVPASHMTTIDHDMKLPTQHYRPERVFGGQVFCRHQANEAQWLPWQSEGFEYRDTGIHAATKGVARVTIIKSTQAVSTTKPLQHRADIFFVFVLNGAMMLSVEGVEPIAINAGDAYVIPPGLNYVLSECTPNLELLEVALPAAS